MNVGHTFGYGHDEYTLGVEARVAQHFGDDAQAFFVFNGTGANVLSLRAACRPCEAAICAETAHLNVDECGAPEAIAGVKLLTVAGDATGSSPRSSSRAGSRGSATSTRCSRARSRSRSAPSSARSTRRRRLRALAELAHAHDMLLHVDGARLSQCGGRARLSLAEVAATAA